ncbi:TetR/AcrR family transcriptional regulator [Streptomyces sp. NPDC102360]|uniref:TetR/AcrR family transcriptional regulator n=1 Tax=Streptomyces sp. NPDC102360 TaxID=3366160 RepID=UPI003807CE5C
MGYDSAATKERLLTAATAEFAAHGVSGARVDRIAKNAGANKRAIYDYYGDKNALFTAVLERALADLARDVPPSEDLPAYAEHLFDYHRKHPEALRLVMWEALEMGEGPVPGEEERTRHYGDKIHAAQLGGAPDAEAGTQVFFTLALAGWTIAMPQLRRMLLGPDCDLDQLRENVGRAVQAMLTPADNAR